MAFETVLQDALALPVKERNKLAAALLQSLYPDDGGALSRDEWERAWTTEIERRLRDLDEGRTTAISYEEFKNRVRTRLSQP